MHSKYIFWFGKGNSTKDVTKPLEIPCKNIKTPLSFVISTTECLGGIYSIALKNEKLDGIKFKNLKASCDFYEAQYMSHVTTCETDGPVVLTSSRLQMCHPGHFGEITVVDENRNPFSEIDLLGQYVLDSDGPDDENSQMCFQIAYDTAREKIFTKTYVKSLSIPKLNINCELTLKLLVDNDEYRLELVTDSSPSYSRRLFMISSTTYAHQHRTTMDFDKDFSVTYSPHFAQDDREYTEYRIQVLLKVNIDGRWYKPSKYPMNYMEVPVSMKDCLSLSQNMASSFLNPDYSDITISADGKDFPCHKVILASRSPVFAANFSNGWKDSEIPVLTYDDISKETMEQVLYYVYTGTVNYDKAVLCTSGLFAASCRFHMLKLKQMCLEIITESVTIENAVEYLIQAYLHDCEEIIEVVLEFAVANAIEFTECKGWKSILDCGYHGLIEMVFKRCCSYMRQRKEFNTDVFISRINSRNKK